MPAGVLCYCCMKVFNAFKRLWKFLGVEMLLVLVIVVMATGIIATYVIALIDDDVRAVWPYISDTGNYPPERCIFTLTTCTEAAISSLVIFIHYKHVKHVVNEGETFYLRLNNLCLFVGFVSTFGLLLVGSFQDETSLKVIHYIGAGLVFLGGTLYCCLETVIGRHISKVYQHQQRLWKTYIRAVICVALIVFCIVEIVTIIVANHQLHSDDTNGEHTHHNRFKWAPSDSGYVTHVISAYVEWLLAILLFSFFLTYIKEFRAIQVETVISNKDRYNSTKERLGYTPIPGN